MRYYTYKYINGNYLVTSAGTTLTKEAFRANEELVSDFPDSIDLKLSNRCSNGCPFCHESSVPDGKIFDLEKTKQVLSQLPELPIEIAIGGGNIMESLDEIKGLTDWLTSRGNLIRGTIKFSDIVRATDEDFEKLISIGFGGIGLSIEERDLDTIMPRLDIITDHLRFLTQEEREFKEKDILVKRIEKLSTSAKGNIVFHIIAGLFPENRLSELSDQGWPVLILGYKQYGRAKNTPLPSSIPALEKVVKHMIFKDRIRITTEQGDNTVKLGRVLSFDNLSLEQLHIKDALLKSEWERLYMGNEGQHSMYIDAVEGRFARNSRSDERTSWNKIGLIEYFKSLCCK